MSVCAYVSFLRIGLFVFSLICKVLSSNYFEKALCTCSSLLLFLSKFYSAFVIFSEFWIPWLHSKSTDAWTLLHLCKSELKSTRLLGVRLLASEKSWECKSADFFCCKNFLFSILLITEQNLIW